MTAAQVAYNEKRNEIDNLLDGIKRALEEHKDEYNTTDRRNWGYAGDLTYVASQLSDIRDFLAQEGEYA